MRTKIYLGDCLDVLPTIPDSSIDLVVTSPPYDNLRTYNDTLDFTFEKFKQIACELYRIAKVVVWIVGDSTEGGSESGTSFKQALYFKEIGFLLHDTMIWEKISPYQHKNRYIPSFEYMFVLSKHKIKSANLIRDRKNKYAGVKIHGTERQASGHTKPLSTKQKSKVVKEFSARTNVWKMSCAKNRGEIHPATFPISLARDHIISWSNVGDVVLDPFMGSGTVGLACDGLGRRFIGIEKEIIYFNATKKKFMEIGLIED